eukprot:1979332-Prymnesium_polylepis.1
MDSSTPSLAPTCRATNGRLPRLRRGGNTVKNGTLKLRVQLQAALCVDGTERVGTREGSARPHDSRRPDHGSPGSGSGHGPPGGWG